MLLLHHKYHSNIFVQMLLSNLTPNVTHDVIPNMTSVNLSSNNDDKLKIYRENFEKAYIEATENFYKEKASEFKCVCLVFLVG